MEKTFSHIVEVDAGGKAIIIDRLYADGRREHYTVMDLDKLIGADKGDVVADVANQLGEALILDSPQARYLLKL